MEQSMNSITENYQAVNSRVCFKCGQPFFSWDRGCMDRDCPIGAQNREWVRADAEYHRQQDELGADRAYQRYADERNAADLDLDHDRCMGW